MRRLLFGLFLSLISLPARCEENASAEKAVAPATDSAASSVASPVDYEQILKAKIEAFKKRLAEVEKRGVGVKNYLNLLAPIEGESREPALDRLLALERLEKAIDRQLADSFEGKARRGEMGLTFLKPDGKPDYDLYISMVQYRMKRLWSPPSRNYSWKIFTRFKIDPKGHIFDVEIPSPSNDAELNSCVRTALDKASPFPPPPPGDSKGVKIEFTFAYNFHPKSSKAAGSNP